MDSNYTVMSQFALEEEGELSDLPLDGSDNYADRNTRRADDKIGDDDDEDDDDDLDFHRYGVSSSGSSNGAAIRGSVFNLATSIIGAGIMALPATIKVLGLALGTTLIMLMGILSEISIEMLVRFSVLTNSRSYGDVVHCALGRTGKILCKIAIIVNNAGVLIAYLIIIGDVLSGSRHHVGILDQLLGNGVWDDRKLVILIVLLVLLAPLCSLNRIDSLSSSSAASVALAVVFLIVCVAVAAIKLVGGEIRQPLRIYPRLDSKKAVVDLLVVIPIIASAYVCHFNVLPIYNELRNPSPRKMNRVARMTTALCVVVYELTAVSGYLLFGDDTESDVLINFDRDLGIKYSSALNSIVRIGYVLHLVLVFPVVHFSLRQTTDSIFFAGSLPLSESRRRSTALTALLLALVYFGSTIIPNIWDAFKFTGATTAVSLAFIFPSLIALRLSQQKDRLCSGEKLLAWWMLMLAVVAGIVGTIANVYGLEVE